MPTYTYDELQSAAADQVKFYLRQTGTTAATRDFSDEEIIACYNRATVNTQRAKVYWTAADLINTLVISHAAKGGGIDTRKLSKLSITYGGRAEKLQMLVNMRDAFYKLAAKYSRTKPRAAKIINASGVRS